MLFRSYKPTNLDISAISIQEGQDIINSIELPEEELLEYKELLLVPLLEPSISTSSYNLNSKTTNNQTSRTNEDITSEYSQTSLEDSASQSNNSGASTSQSSDSEATISQSSDFKANTSQLNDFETSNSNSRTSNNAFRQDNNQISVNIPMLPEHLKRKYELSEEDNNTIIKHQRTSSYKVDKDTSMFAGFHQAFTSSLYHTTSKLHQSNLQSPPRNWSELLKHSQSKYFLKAT